MPRPFVALTAGALAVTALAACSHPSTPATTPATPVATATQTVSTTTTATASTTHTVGATATATQTSTATAQPVTTSSATTQDSGPALTQSFCIPSANLCLHYPAGYRIVKDPVPGDVPQGGEFGHLANPQGNPLFYYSYYETAGVAGQKIPDGAPEQLVLRAQRSDATTDNSGSKPVYASTMIVQDSDGYFPRQFLTTADRASNPGSRFNEIIVNFSDIYDLRYASKHTLNVTTRSTNGPGVQH